jgi:hypothetical protein
MSLKYESFSSLTDVSELLGRLNRALTEHEKGASILSMALVVIIVNFTSKIPFPHKLKSPECLKLALVFKMQ